MIRPILVLSCALLFALPARAADSDKRVYLDFDAANFRPYQIAVPDARTATSAKELTALSGKLVTTIRQDLAFSGLFKVLDPRSFITRPEQEGLAVGTIRFDDWANVAAEGLVKVGITVEGAKVTADFHLYSVTSRRESLHKTYVAPKGAIRLLAHRFCDDLVAHFTKVPGIFQTRLAVVKKAGRDSELWVMDFDGRNQRKVPIGKSINLLPAWDAGGTGLLFTSFLRGTPDLYRFTFSSGKTTPLSTRRGLNMGAAVSPDGRKIALTLSQDGNSEIYVMNSDGSGLTRLTNSWGIDSSPTWSPDGSKIAFVSSRAGNPHIYTMNADGSEQTRLTFQGKYNQTPDWSPRGDLIAFTARDERNVFDIFVVSPETGKITRLTQDQGNNEEPSFSPDGRHVVFTSTRSGSSQVYICNTDGSNQRRITQDKADYSTPAWSPFLVQEKK